MSKEGQARVLDEDELKIVEAVISKRENAARNQSMIDFSFRCGMRVKEIASLYLSDVVNNDGTIKKSFTLKVAQTKGIKNREIFLDDPNIMRNLKAYLAVRGDHKGPLFQSRKGGSFSPNTMQIAFKNMFKAAGMDGCSSHSGRRSFATKLINNGMDIVMVSELMGHASIEMTRKYVATNPITKAKAIRGLFK